MGYCVLDFETRSQCDLKKRGTWNYSVDPTTEILCLSYKFENEPAVVIPRERIPTCHDEICKMFSADLLIAHNSFFEQSLIMNIGTPRYGWPRLPFEKLRCSAALAAMHSLPRSLEGAGAALGLPIQKDAEGHRLMLKMSKPRKPRKGEDPNGIYWHESPEDLARLYSYCARDVEAEEMLVKALRPLPEKELKVWQVDQAINRRGFAVDVAACRAMITAIADHERALLAELADITGGAVRTGKQTAALLKFLEENGVPLPDLQAATVEEALNGGGWAHDRVTRRTLELRQALARASSAKYAAMLRAAGPDGRVRDTLRYHGAGRTGRWAGKDVQPQNFASRIQVSGGESDDEQLFTKESMLATVVAGGYPLFRALYEDDFMTAAGAMTRSVIWAAAGHEFICADLNAIEGRSLAWLAGEEWVLNEYRANRDMYKVVAARCLSKKYEDITPYERKTYGKPGDLACIAQGQLVLTEAGLLPIEKVSRMLRVWDGVEWVSHDGPIFRGYREVMDYDGLQATPDHVVFTEEGEEIGLREAARRGARLVTTGLSGSPVRLGEGYQSGNPDAQALPGDSGRVSRMQDDQVDRSGESARREDRGVPALQPASCCSRVVSASDGRGAAALPESGQCAVQELRRPGHRVSFSQSDSGGALGNGEPRDETGSRNRPGQQQRPLRAGESSLVDEAPESKQHEVNGSCREVSPVPGSASGDSLRRRDLAEIGGEVHVRADRREVSQTELQTERPVWDLLNCGPRHRFTVSGKLVHNCGYQGAVGAVRKFGGDGMEDDEIMEKIVTPWRESRPLTVKLWADMEEAALEAVAFPGKICTVRNGLVMFKMCPDKFLRMRLPSGRFIHYYDAIVRPEKTKWKKMKDTLSYMGVDAKTHQWVRMPTYGGRLVENLCQSFARDVLVEGMFNLESAGYPLVATVHDEIISEVPIGFGSATEFENLMTVVPSWAPGLPLKAKGWRGMRYRK